MVAAFLQVFPYKQLQTKLYLVIFPKKIPVAATCHVSTAPARRKNPQMYLPTSESPESLEFDPNISCSTFSYRQLPPPTQHTSQNQCYSNIPNIVLYISAKFFFVNHSHINILEKVQELIVYSVKQYVTNDDKIEII